MSESLYEDETNTPAKPKVSDNKKPKQLTQLDKLRETITKKVERPVVLLEVPERPGVYLRISPNITQNQMRAWRRNAGEDTKAGMDPTKFACYVIGSTTVGIEMHDEEIFDEDGHPLNFASADILDMTEAMRPIPDAVRAFFGVDPHVESGALAILEAAGFSDTVDTTDPMKGSSTN